MFNNGMTGGYSLADIAAATGGNNSRSNDDWGGGGAWWIIILFLFCFNGGLFGDNWGRGNNCNTGGGGGYAAPSIIPMYQGTTTREEIAYGFDMNNLENNVRGIQQGLCDGFYAMNTSMLNGFSGVESAITAGTRETMAALNGMNIANMQNTNALTAQLANMAADNAACCCSTQRQIEKGFCDLNYNLATQSCDTRRTVTDASRDIIDNANSNTRAILDFLTQDKIATLTAENQSLKFAASQQAQNAFITANQEAQTAELIRRLGRDVPTPAYIVPNPNCCYDYTNSCCCG